MKKESVTNTALMWIMVLGFFILLINVNSVITRTKDLSVQVATVSQKVDNLKVVAQRDTANANPVTMEDLIDDDAVKGNLDAPVTIVEWSDYECPFCARFYKETYGQIVTNYIDTGKVKLVFRDFPLNFHANAQKAAEAAECAGEQDKYYDMHDKLFSEGVTGGATTFKKYATEIGLDITSFNACLDSGEMASEVNTDLADGVAVGIKGTPGFIINGQLVSGAQPYAVFEAAIENALGS